MKSTNLILAALFVMGLTTQAAIFSQGTVSGGGTAAGVGTFNQTITDGNPSGMWNQIAVSGVGSSLTDIKVTLNISGGYNGDLYGYLSYGGVLVPLINRVGVGTQGGTSAFGFSTSGFNNITLASTGSDIHLASGALSGTYAADGRAISPLLSASSYNAAGTVTLDGQFGSMNPNGTWTLFLADVVSGGGNATLLGWNLEITAVPEPTTMGLIGFGVVFALTGGVRRWRGRASVR